MNKDVSSCIGRFIFAYIGSLISLFTFFLTTMLVHNRGIDYEYLSYATLRMLVISIVPGILGVITSKLGKIWILFIGVFTGPLVAAVFINIAIKMK